ncbi:MAG: sulfotransferase domain-containing protein [Rhodothermales bacterium]
MTDLRRYIPAWIRRPARSVRRTYRELTWRSRSLPDFLIIGAQKAGTSSLFAYLGQHPQLIPSHIKEVHFFDGGLDEEVDTYGLGEAWYRSHFPRRRMLGPDRMTFEASPLYLFNPLAPMRISDLVPEARLIAILRNPTERAISHYHHFRRIGWESLPMLEAFRSEESRLASAIEQEYYKSPSYIRYSYKRRGLYRNQLARYLEHFPMRKMFIASSEAFFARPRTVLDDVLDFLELDGYVEAVDVRPRNVGSYESNSNAEARDYLDAYFRPHNEALFELIGRRFNW